MSGISTKNILAGVENSDLAAAFKQPLGLPVDRISGSIMRRVKWFGRGGLHYISPYAEN